jgi:hypothetical protein
VTFAEEFVTVFRHFRRIGYRKLVQNEGKVVSCLLTTFAFFQMGEQFPVFSLGELSSRGQRGQLLELLML